MSALSMKARREKQLALTFRTRGGKRKGAGRKPGQGGERAWYRRPVFTKRLPVHVTLRMAEWVWNLRSRRSLRVFEKALIQGADRLGVRVVQFSIQGNHVHLLVEADHSTALARGIKESRCATTTTRSAHEPQRQGARRPLRCRILQDVVVRTGEAAVHPATAPSITDPIQKDRQLRSRKTVDNSAGPAGKARRAPERSPFMTRRDVQSTGARAAMPPAPGPRPSAGLAEHVIPPRQRLRASDECSPRTTPISKSHAPAGYASLTGSAPRARQKPPESAHIRSPFDQGPSEQIWV